MTSLGTKNHGLEKFGERVDWIVANLPCSADPSEPTRNLLTRAELWRLITQRTGLDPNRSKRTWKRATSPKDDYPVPDVFVKGILGLYPDLLPDVLTTEKFEDFESHTRAIQAAQARWQAAALYVTNNRASLADLGKAYYRCVDEQQAFPLITKTGWLLDPPRLLPEIVPPATYRPLVSDIPAPKLEGLNVDYHLIRSRLAPKGRKPTNGDCYRLLEIEPTPNGLDFVLSRTGYFQYINWLEANGALLADFALRQPGMPISKFKNVRVPPEELFSFEKRSMFPGVSCLLLAKNYFVGTSSDRQRLVANKFALHWRGSTTIEAQNTVHVVPAGGHQPLAESYGDDREISIWRTVVREFCEELFNKEEAAKLKRRGEDFLSLPEVRPLVDGFFKSGATKVYLLGAGLDPVTTKPEILVAIVADWKKASTKTEIHLKDNYEGTAKWMDLSRGNLLREANLPRPDKVLLPAGKACLLLAHKHYNILMGDSE
jgi:hypothetical protein